MSDTITSKPKRTVRHPVTCRAACKRDHSRYISHLQKKVLVKYLEKYPVIVGNKAAKLSGEYCSKNARNKWEELSKILNRLPGANKSWTEWRKTWHDFRHTTRLRYLQNHTCASAIDIDILKLSGDISKDTIAINEKDFIDEDNVEQLINNMIDTIPKPSSVSEENILIEILPHTSKIDDTSPKEVYLEEKVFMNDDSMDNVQYEFLSNSNMHGETYDEKSKFNYYNKKLILLARIARAKERSADAKERIAQALEKIAEDRSQIF